MRTRSLRCQELEMQKRQRGGRFACAVGDDQWTAGGEVGGWRGPTLKSRIKRRRAAVDMVPGLEACVGEGMIKLKLSLVQQARRVKTDLMLLVRWTAFAMRRFRE